MYRNEFLVVPWALRSTPSGVLAGTSGVVPNAGEHNELYLYVARGSAFPSYSDRGPDLDVRVEIPPFNMIGAQDVAPAMIATSFSIDFGSEPSTAKGYWVDITPWALGRIAVIANLSEGGGGATARATYAITVIGRGYS